MPKYPEIAIQIEKESGPGEPPVYPKTRYFQAKGEGIVVVQYR